MVRPGRERLAGHVEVDEGYVGGVESSVQGRKTETKAIVAIAVEIKNPKGFGRIRLRHVPDVTADSLLPFIDQGLVVNPTNTGRRSRVHPNPVGSPTFPPFIVPGAETPQQRASLTQMDNPFARLQLLSRGGAAGFDSCPILLCCAGLTPKK